MSARGAARRPWPLAVGALVVLVACGPRFSTPVTTTTGPSTTTMPSGVTTAPTSGTTTTTSTATTTTTAPPATSTAVTTTTMDAAGTTATITANWERFFSATTSIADREALLENGPSLHQALVERAADPLMRQASAKVRHVALTDATHASVTYDVLLNGTVALADSTGVAVLQDGVWKVSADSFCALISLGATAPIPGCS